MSRIFFNANKTFEKILHVYCKNVVSKQIQKLACWEVK